MNGGSRRRHGWARRDGGRALASLCIAALGMPLGGCSPALDWRVARPAGWGVEMLLPCRPTRQERDVAVAGIPLALGMLACQADGHTFSMASARLDDPGRIGAVLASLGEATRANLQGRVDGERAALVKGMTPHSAARWWRLAGALPDGREVRAQSMLFAHGTRVFQATVIGPRADDAMVGTFFESIAIVP